MRFKNGNMYRVGGTIAELKQIIRRPHSSVYLLETPDGFVRTLTADKIDDYAPDPFYNPMPPQAPALYKSSLLKDAPLRPICPRCDSDLYRYQGDFCPGCGLGIDWYALDDMVGIDG